MSTSKLMKVTYYDPKSQIRLLCYADTVVWDTKPTPTLTALRFGGYPAVSYTHLTLPTNSLV